MREPSLLASREDVSSGLGAGLGAAWLSASGGAWSTLVFCAQAASPSRTGVPATSNSVAVHDLIGIAVRLPSCLGGPIMGQHLRLTGQPCRLRLRANRPVGPRTQSGQVAVK